MKKLVRVLLVSCMLLGIVVYEMRDDLEEMESTESVVVSTEMVESEECETETQEEEKPKIDIVMIGDMLLHMPIEEQKKQEDGSYDFSSIFAHTRETIENADLALVNQEVIIGGTELGISGYPCFNAPYEIADELVETGFDVICQGTNHALDKGKKGILNCETYWETTYPQIEVLGIYSSEEEANEITVVEKEGMRIALLNYTYGTNGINLPKDMPYGVDLLEEKKVLADIKKAEEIADFTIVCPHWGTEYRLEADAMQEKWTKLFLEKGVDLVIGTHPHVIEPVEFLKDEETGHEMLVYYSLGNFVSWTSSTGHGVTNRMLGAMAQISIGRNDNSEKVEILDYGIEPVVCHLTKEGEGVTVYPLSEYSQELAEENEIRKQDGEFSYGLLKELCQQVFGELSSMKVE